MTGSCPDNGHAEARALLDLYASVGATSFDVTWTNAHAEKQRFRRGMSLAALTRTLPRLLDEATRRQHNLIVRPNGTDRTFIQLDDLTADRLPRIAPPVFLQLQTSPGSFQAWLAIAGSVEKDFGTRLKRGTGADVNASGATRIAGSLNFKEKYAPDFPRVVIHQANAGRLTSVIELERLGLVAPAEILPTLSPSPARNSVGGNRTWPSYTYCLDRAPLNAREDGPDTSKADIVWCMTAIDWGFGVEETARRLMEEPDSKAYKRGEKYALDTARHAAAYVQKRRQQSKS